MDSVDLIGLHSCIFVDLAGRQKRIYVLLCLLVSLNQLTLFGKQTADEKDFQQHVEKEMERSLVDNHWVAVLFPIGLLTMMASTKKMEAKFEM